MALLLKGFIEVANPLFIISTDAYTFKPLSLNAFKDIDGDWMAHLTVTHKTDFRFYLEFRKTVLCTLILHNDTLRTS